MKSTGLFFYLAVFRVDSVYIHQAKWSFQTCAIFDKNLPIHFFITVSTRSDRISPDGFGVNEQFLFGAS